MLYDFPGGSDSKASAYNVGDPGSIPGSGRSPGEGNGNSLQYSCLENPMGRGAWLATVRGVAKSRTRLGDFTITNSMPVRFHCMYLPLARISLSGAAFFQHHGELLSSIPHQAKSARELMPCWNNLDPVIYSTGV